MTAQTAGQFRLLYGNTMIGHFTTSAAVNYGTVLQLASSAVLQATGGTAEVVAGIAATSAGSGEVVPVYMDGVFEATADATDLACGGVVYLEDAGLVGDGDAKDISIGFVVNTNPAASGTVQFALRSFAHHTPTTHA